MAKRRIRVKVTSKTTKRQKRKKKLSPLIIFLIIGGTIVLIGVLSIGILSGWNIDKAINLVTFNSISSGAKDRRRPVIYLKGAQSMSIEQDKKWVEPGYYAKDNRDGNITSRVVVTGEVKTNVLGLYKLTYTVKDRAGNRARTKIRMVTVVQRGVK